MSRFMFNVLSSFILAVNVISAELPSKYVSGYGFMKSCDVTLKDSSDPRTYIFPEKLQKGDVVWVQSYWVSLFC